jgi:type II secretory pathway component GspD/PulD (secretin)
VITPLPRLFAAAALVAALQIPPARAADEPVTLNFVNADIEAVVKAVAEMTGRNFVLDPRVKGVINIVSARPVPASLVYPRCGCRATPPSRPTASPRSCPRPTRSSTARR